jgi:hypothetical protein
MSMLINILPFCKFNSFSATLKFLEFHFKKRQKSVNLETF